MNLREAEMEAAARPLTEDERALLAHWSRWGSDGYNVFRVKGGWLWTFRTLGAPRVFKTKRETVAQLETFIKVLVDQSGLEARARYMREHGIAEVNA